MKTTIIKSAVLLIIALVGIGQITAQEYPCTVIDVKGSRYGDSMWLFTVEGTTDGYDNGWDGYKILGSSLSPQIFALDACATKFQVMTSSNVHGTNIGFIPGEDNAYTLNFTHYSLNLGYQQLYLVDKLKNQTVDIYAQGSLYSFECASGDVQDRFSVITFIEPPVDTTKVVDEDPIVVVPEEPVVVVPDEPAVEEPGDDVTEEPTGDKGNGKNNKGGKKKCIKVFSTSDMVVIDNPYKEKGKVRVINAKTGRQVKQFNVGAKQVTSVRVDVKRGNYIVNVTVGNEVKNTTVIL